MSDDPPKDHQRAGQAFARARRNPLVLASVILAAIVATISGVFGTVALTHRSTPPPSGAQARATVIPRSSPAPRPTPTAALDPLPTGNDWTQYRFDVSGNGMNPENGVDVSDAATLALRWRIPLSAAFESTPAVVGGTLYVTNGNSLYAFDRATTALRWRFDATPQQIATVSSSVAVDPALHLAFYGNPDARVYAVNTDTGDMAWSVRLSTSPGAYVWSSPLVINGAVYIGLASHDDNPCVRGAVYALDERTGATHWTHYTAPAGTLGGGVWSSLVANPTLHELIATTGNPCLEDTAATEEDSILGLDWDTGALRWRYQALAYDDCDCDFGQGAVDAVYQSREYIVAGNKYGAIYALARDPSGGTPQLAWTKRISPAGYLGQGGIFEPPTYANGLVYIAGGPSFNGACQRGGLYALHVESGAEAWHACTAGQVVSPAALSDGVLFVAQQDVLVAYEASTGRVLKRLAQPGSTWGGVTISHGEVFIGTVSSTLYCYAVTTT